MAIAIDPIAFRAMPRRLLVTAVAATVTFATAAADADPLLRTRPAIRAVPAFVASMPTAGAWSFWLPNVVVKPVDSDVFAKIERAIDALPKPAFARWKDDGPRDPRLRDPARARDAISLGLVRPPPVSKAGAALAGLGAGVGGSLSLTRVNAKLPLRFGPILTAGGGGVRLTCRF